MLEIIQDPKFLIEIEVPKVTVIVGTPTKRDYFKLIQEQITAAEYLEKYSVFKNDLPPFTESTSEKFIADVVTALKKYRQENMDLFEVPERMDFGNKKPSDKIDFPIPTMADNAVYKYTGLNFLQQLDMLSIVEYWLVLADSVKARLSETEKGREILHECYMDMHQISTIKPNI